MQILCRYGRVLNPCPWKPLGLIVRIIPYGMLRDRFFSQTSPSRVSTLSERMCSGIPWSIIASASTSITWLLLILRPTWIARHSRVYSSIRFRNRTVLPSWVYALSRVEHQRRAASLPSDSDARPPNRTCTFRYASGSPGTQTYAGVRIHPLRKRSTRSMERRNCSTLPSRQTLRVGRIRLGSRTSRVLLRRRFLCFFINQRQTQSPI